MTLKAADWGGVCDCDTLQMAAVSYLVFISWLLNLFDFYFNYLSSTLLLLLLLIIIIITRDSSYFIIIIIIIIIFTIF